MLWQFDWSKGDPTNFIGVVLKRDPTGCTIGTRAGIIIGTLARNQNKFVKFSGFKAGNVLAENYIVRELVRGICGGQEYVQCHCPMNCLTKRCSCLKNDLPCNSACHSHKSCDNVDNLITRLAISNVNNLSM